MRLLIILSIVLIAGCGEKDDDNSNNNVRCVNNTNNATYLEHRDRFGYYWYQFKSNRMYCMGRVGQRFAECVWRK